MPVPDLTCATRPGRALHLPALERCYQPPNLELSGSDEPAWSRCAAPDGGEPDHVGPSKADAMLWPGPRAGGRGRCRRAASPVAVTSGADALSVGAQRDGRPGLAPGAPPANVRMPTGVEKRRAHSSHGSI